jgi:hypothetical protein
MYRDSAHEQQIYEKYIHESLLEINDKFKLIFTHVNIFTEDILVVSY